MRPAAHRAVMASRQASAADDPDFFPTPPWAGRAGAELVRAHDPRAKSVWEPACGAGHLVHALRGYFPIVSGSDAYPYDGNPIFDFAADAIEPGAFDWVITNPPFRDGLVEAFIRRAYLAARRGVSIFGRVGLLETVGRYGLLTAECPLTVFAPFSERVPLAKGRWDPDGSTAAFYAWFLWLKPDLKPHRFMARGPDGGWNPGTQIIPPGQEARLTRADDAALFGVSARAAVPPSPEIAVEPGGCAPPVFTTSNPANFEGSKS